VKAIGIEKVAVTARAALIVTEQLPVPVQAPLQPVKVEPAAGVAVKVTAVPVVNDAEHEAPQLMPAGLLVTVPLPAPALVTVSAKVGRANVAVTARAALIVTEQLPVPVQAPLQPVKVEPAVGAAVRVTAVPVVNGAEQVAPQLMPVGLLVTVPVPVPALVTVSVEEAATPVPVTSRETESPSAVKLTFELMGVVVVGVNRTVIVAVAPVVASEKGLPETMEKGAATEAVPDTPSRVLRTVKVWSTKLPMLTLPNATVVVGLTVKVPCATALATLEQALMLPDMSPAATETLKEVPVVRPVSRTPTV
jgi:hypothetical protein